MSENAFIKVSDLYKIYKMGNQEVRALDGVSLELEKGSFNVLMGPSGSGKSTLLYLVGGLDWPTSGHIVVDGEQIDKMDENQLARYRREKLGFIFQSFNLITSMTAVANVAFPLRFSGVKKSNRTKRALGLLEKMGLEKRVHHKPTELSGGQQQRVAVSRALVNNPGVILADEPTGNLDTASGVIIMDLLKELREEGKTILVATHDLRMLHYASNAIFLIDGKEVSEENYRKIIQQQG